MTPGRTTVAGMLFSVLTALALQAVVTITSAAPAPADEARGLSGPTVSTSGGTFVGNAEGDVHQFYGIPFAEPP